MDNILKSKTRVAAVQVIFQSLINQRNILSIKNEFDQFYRKKILDIDSNKIEYNTNFLSKLIDFYISTSSTFDFNSSIDQYLKFERLFDK